MRCDWAKGRFAEACRELLKVTIWRWLGLAKEGADAGGWTALSEADAADEVYEAGIVANGIKVGMHFDEGKNI